MARYAFFGSENFDNLPYFENFEILKIVMRSLLIPLRFHLVTLFKATSQ